MEPTSETGDTRQTIDEIAKKHNVDSGRIGTPAAGVVYEPVNVSTVQGVLEEYVAQVPNYAVTRVEGGLGVEFHFDRIDSKGKGHADRVDVYDEAKGRLCESRFYAGDKAGLVTSYRYDANGRLIERTISKGDLFSRAVEKLGTIVTRERFSYVVEEDTIKTRTILEKPGDSIINLDIISDTETPAQPIPEPMGMLKSLPTNPVGGEKTETHQSQGAETRNTTFVTAAKDQLQQASEAARQGNIETTTAGILNAWDAFRASYDDAVPVEKVIEFATIVDGICKNFPEDKATRIRNELTVEQSRDEAKVAATRAQLDTLEKAMNRGDFIGAKDAMVNAWRELYEAYPNGTIPRRAVRKFAQVVTPLLSGVQPAHEDMYREIFNLYDTTDLRNVQIKQKAYIMLEAMLKIPLLSLNDAKDIAARAISDPGYTGPMGSVSGFAIGSAEQMGAGFLNTQTSEWINNYRAVLGKLERLIPKK